MGTTYIDIGGQERPLRYGFAALRLYEERTGRNSLSDFASLHSGQASVTLMTDLLYCGLANGARSEGLKVDFDEFTVADWVGADMSVVEKAMKVFSDSFPTEKDGGDAAGAAKKKAKPWALKAGG